MRPFGQGRPTAHRCVCARLIAATAAMGWLILAAGPANAAELDVRIRFAWGSGGHSPQKWRGSITVPGAKLSNLQPLGVEADEAAAVRLVGDEVLVEPLVRLS